MRVTQSMLANNSLRHMSNSYRSLGVIQDKLATGKKITRASQDPVVAMNGMRYRTQVTEVEQFKRNLGEVYNWMDTADATLDKVTQAVHRIRELTTQASNDTYDSKQRANISKEIAQLREHLITLGNTKANNKYIFNGTNTTSEPIDSAKMDVSIEDPNFQAAMTDAPLNFVTDDYEFPYEATYGGELYQLEEVSGNYVFVSDSGKKINIDGTNVIEHEYVVKDESGNDKVINETLTPSQLVISYKDAVSTNDQNVNIEVLKGVNVTVNVDPNKVFSNDFFGEIIRLENTLEDPASKSADITKFLDNLDKQMDKVVNERAELGAIYNRVEMIEVRVMEQQVISERILSNNEDADIEKVIIDLKSQESVHRAALAASARIIQPSLLDFLR